jgi:hypothetical protein
LFLQRNGSDPCGNCKNDPIRCVSCPKFEPLWNALSSFIQGSNIAQADHLEVKIREVCCKDIEVTPDVVRGYTQCYEQLPQSRKMRLWKMEHDRWCRYMYIHGWEYAPVRDNSAKKHPLLVPFEQLDEHEWNKDAGAFFDVPKLIET